MAKAPTAMTRAVETSDVATTFERMAKDPNVDVSKFERLVALFERGEARKSETAFNAAMSAAQREMRPISKDSANPSTRSRYASYEAIDSALRPIYSAHGFALSFNTSAEVTAPDRVLMTCLVTHEMGHSREYRLDMPADGKGARGTDVMTKTHAVGSAVSYGMRYLLKMVFNVAEDDDDGNKAGARPVALPPQEPEGYQQWWHDMQAVADEGSAKLAETWVKSNAVFKRYLVDTNNAGWLDLKKKADDKMKPAPREKPDTRARTQGNDPEA